MRKLYSCLLLVLMACSSPKSNDSEVEKGFIKVNTTSFEIDGKPYYYLGTNFWYGLNLGSNGEGGDRERLIRELDRLKSMGVNNLRVMAGSEGPDNEPWRMLPSLQTSPGKYNEEVLEGLDFLLNEMKKRDMYAVMCLNNFWPWSGGMGQYLVWAGAADSIPYPPPHPGGDWHKYAVFTAKFYSNKKATDMFDDHIRFMVNRKNAYSNLLYKNDPTIMSWQLANEPRGTENTEDFKQWIDNTSALIKSLDPNHLVTTGSEGSTPSEQSSGTNPIRDHNSENIDYATFHIWVQNWEIFNPEEPEETYPKAVKYAADYIQKHVEDAKKLNKPIVLEEFGISRDANSHDASSTTEIRDKYYREIFEMVYNNAKEPGNPLSGVNFWAWGGEGRPSSPHSVWKLGDDFIGDPPHEYQGWYSVYETDSSTISVIKEFAEKMNGLDKEK